MKNTPTRRPGRWADRLASLGLLAVAVLALATIALAQPAEDDFNRAVVARPAWFGYVFRYTYLHWSGRWAGVGFSAFVLPRLDPTRCYPLLLGGLHAAQFAALAVFWRLLLGRRAGWRPLAGRAVGTYALLWALSPVPGETYYWFSGGVEYFLSLSLGVLLIGALAHGCRRLGEGSLGGWVWVAGGGALAFAASGMHELAGCALCVALLAGLAAAGLRVMRNAECGMRNEGDRGSGSLTGSIANDDTGHERSARSKTALAWAVALGCAVAGTLVCVLAPGNAERAASFKNGHSLLITIKSFVKLTALYVLPWALHPALWGATLALWLTPLAGARRLDWLGWPEVPWRWLLPLATLALAGVWLAGPSWAMGGTNGRALDATQLCFMLGWLASAVAWGAHWGWLRGVRGARRRRLRTAALCVMLAGVLLAGNTRRVVRYAVTGKARAWSRQMDRQREAAHRADESGVRDAAVPRIKATLPPFFYSSGITPDPTDWRNQSYAAFFKLRTVRTGEQEIPKVTKSAQLSGTGIPARDGTPRPAEAH